MSYKEDEEKYGIGVYPKLDIVIVRGKGTKIYTDDGKELIDCVTGYGVAAIGHCNPDVVKAISEQANTLMTCAMTAYNDKRSMLLKKLIEISPKSLTKAFLCNSGTEAIEGAIKFARVSTKKIEFISCQRGFHGRTLGALSATWNREYQEPFEPLVPGFHKVPYNDIEAINAILNPNIAGIILECVQGEGGIYVGDREYFREVRKICDERGILLIIDEVQTGFGRTGKLFACEHFGIEPDIMAIAKAMGGGFPIGAILVNGDKVKVPKKSHGTTFGGNPLACAAALAAIDFIVDNKLDEKASSLGAYFISELKTIKSEKIREIRGLGLMVAIDLKEKSSPYLKRLYKKGIFAMQAGPTVIRFLPPLIITKEEIDIIVNAVRDVL